MTARIFFIPEKARGHGPRLQLPIVWFCNTLAWDLQSKDRHRISGEKIRCSSLNSPTLRHATLCFVSQRSKECHEPFPMPEIDSNGVDRSQIRRQLELTPSERLQALETFLA